MGQRLDILHERRATGDPALRRPRRDEGRLARSAVEHADERGLLAGEEAAGRGHDADPRAVAPFAQGDLGRAQRPPGLRRDGDDDLAGPDGVRGGERAVEHGVRRALEQQTVLGAHRLALGAVGHDHAAPSLAGDGLELGGRGERAPAASAQPRGADLADQRVRRPRLELEPAVQLVVSLEPESLAAAHPGDQAREHGHPRVPVAGLAERRPSTLVAASFRRRRRRSALPSADPTSASTALPLSRSTRPS